ncbi:hypothetical protein [Burkholderia seminalis]|nr:hypothetical protein [Burkholderia seminalis]MCA8306861.1 hypothetical protein [Burkholderia seminalis]MCA8435450.1 hypothetical protein [Burkholderia seminalis]VWC36489.1 hypothetical protein BSE24067_06717 [Burkholderia seminalis]
MDYRTKNRFGIAVVVFISFVVVLAAVKSNVVGVVASAPGHLHAQQR